MFHRHSAGFEVDVDIKGQGTREMDRRDVKQVLSGKGTCGCILDYSDILYCSPTIIELYSAGDFKT